MNFLEILHEILLALFIAILLPITIYWGVSSIYVNPVYSDFKVQTNIEIKDEKIIEANQKLQNENWQKAKKPFDNAMFFSSIILGFLSIILGSFLSINGLAMGLVAGGLITIFMGLTFGQGVAIINFGILLLLLIFIISLTIIKKNHKNIS
ncbi:MAG: hypothetical protein P4L22_06380 [Candidatus Babeliales bacterium]|nr:hypothetical protein [Candidatus Babeliales bacterium]